MFVYLIGDSQLETVKELAAFHVAVYVVTVDAQALPENRQHGDDGLERSQALVERGLTTTTRHGKTTRKHPVAILVGSLKARDEGSRRFTLEQLCVAAAVLHAVSKGSEG